MACEILTVAQKLTLSRELGFDWETLAGLLGYGRADIEEFKHDAGHYQLQPTIRLMLDRWCQREALNPSALQTVLIPALEEMCRTDLIEKLGFGSTVSGICPISNIKRPVRYFQQRPVLERTITECINEHKIALLSGIHGSGKSQMALNYWLNHHNRNPKSVNWLIYAGTIKSLEQGLMDLGRQLKVRNLTQNDNYKSILTAILRHLHSKMIDGSHFLIFDDISEKCCCDIEECVRSEEAENVHIIMTSLFKDLPCSVPVAGFVEEEVVEFFYKDQYCQKHLKAQDILSLGKDTHHLPLAMAAARSYISKCKINISEYSRRLSSENEKVRRAVWESDHLSRDYDKSMLAAFLLNVQKLKTQLQGEYEPLFTAFQMTAFFGSEDIPLFLLMKSQLRNVDEDERCIMEDYFVENVEKLSMGKVNFLEYEEGSEDCVRLVTVHDAIRQALLLSFDKEEKQTKFKDVFALLVTYMCDKDNRHQKSFSLRCLLFNHLLTLERKLHRYCPDQDMEAQLLHIHLLDVLGYHYSKDLFNTEGDGYLQSALQFICKISGMDYASLFKKESQYVFDKLTLEGTVNRIPLEYLNKFRIQRIYSDVYAEVWQEFLTSRGAQISLVAPDGHLVSPDLKHLIESGIFLKPGLYQKIYLVELMISVLCTYARTYSRCTKVTPDDKKRCYLHACLARDLGLKMKTVFGIDVIQSTIVNRSAILPFKYDKFDLECKEKDPEVFEDDVREALLEFQNMFEDDTVYFQHGVLKSIPSPNLFHQMFCNNKVIMCYKILYQVLEDEEKSREVFQQGYESTKAMMRMLSEIQSLDFQSESWYHIHAAEFLMLSDRIEHIDEAVRYLLSAIALNKKLSQTRQKQGNLRHWLTSLKLLVNIYTSTTKQNSLVLDKATIIAEIQIYNQTEVEEGNLQKASGLIEHLHQYK